MHKLFSAIIVTILINTVILNGQLKAQDFDNHSNLLTCFEQDINSIQDWEKYSSACSDAQKNASPSERLKIWDTLATKAEQLKLHKISIGYDQKISSHSLLPTSDKIRYSYYRRSGKRAYLKQDLAESEHWFVKTLDAAKALKNDDYISKSYNNLGVLYKRLGQYQLALKMYQQSLVLKLELGDEKMIGNTLYNVGALLLELEKTEEAVEYLDQAITAYLKYQNQLSETDAASINSQILHVYEDMVVANIRLGENEKVELYLQFLKAQHAQSNRASDLSIRSDDIVWGKYYLSIDNPELADGFITRAMKDKNTNPLIAQSAKVSALSALGQIKEAIQLAIQGLEDATINKEYFYVAEFNLHLSELSANQNLEQSMQYLKASYNAKEQFLAEKYNAEIIQITDQIKSQKIERDLIAQQLITSQKEQKISRLTNWILISLCILIAGVFVFINSFFKRQREKEQLLESIEYHKQQWKMLNETVESQNEENAEKQKAEVKQTFNELLVKAMVEAVDVWNRHTGQTRIDLAEKSKVWTISIDNGTLRTRAMDKYLSLKLMPKNPRWRKVVRTCHFILADSDLNPADRELIGRNLKAIMNQL